MTIAYHLGQFVAVTMPEPFIKCVWPHLPPGPCILKLCDCAKEQLQYEIAKLAAIEAGVPFADQAEAKEKCFVVWRKLGLIHGQHWAPNELDTFTVEGEVEIQRQFRHYDEEWRECFDKHSLPEVEYRKVAVFKSPAPAKADRLPKKDASERDWPEDYDQENGNYQNKCCICGLLFYGNKHRVVCKTCTPAKEEAVKEKQERIFDEAYHLIMDPKIKNWQQGRKLLMSLFTITRK